MPTIRDESADSLIAFAQRLADESRGLFRKAASEATRPEIKADRSFVTELDRAIESRLRELIADVYPDHGVLGEEFGSHGLGADLTWVLDPVDGTAPFIAGIPVYGTLIGVSRLGRPWLGVLDYPATDDRWVGVAARYAKRNGRPIRTRRCPDPAAALMTCSNPDFFAADEYQALARVRDEVSYTLYGASSFAHALLASGKVDVSVDCGLKHYDVFAPAAVISGAGGVMTDWSGAELSLNTSSGQTLASGDPKTHQATLNLLKSPEPSA